MKINVEGKDYKIDFDKAKELGLLKEENKDLKCESLEEYCYLEEYWYMNGYGSVSTSFDAGCSLDDELYAISNYFKTEEEAQLASNKTFDIWFKIRVWAIRNNYMKEFSLDGINYSVKYNMRQKNWWECNAIKYYDYGQTILTEEGCIELLKILNNGNYKLN